MIQFDLMFEYILAVFSNLKKVKFAVIFGANTSRPREIYFFHFELAEDDSNEYDFNMKTRQLMQEIALNNFPVFCPLTKVSLLYFSDLILDHFSPKYHTAMWKNARHKSQFHFSNLEISEEKHEFKMWMLCKQHLNGIK